ncbi:tRNA (adenosine(37)-N6)-threonylcarbamoyltransferase complex dimerization subunit type 1 TsaB [Paracoccus sp. CPCC 101403]|uniref:tRNA (Adenosine(37)-N6)-threonylcarbamoyltransferase complex dimerization subunit type 1 TsaB n=2 Tax=Paracoccus broussonetiae TaxID=3075834 RepID=A0ABU3EH03_9RHOB|nr:tRNA (adenosine(37)-N6)-threonylcarbamoyltransferase complex dimerization subunit type 1 TsaB [Paracoccus sp. CPCC 101403]MDT1063527.1 tRNA (adenosine(37)-N6)-threonylcarbamoyltransferase complex dimerization subunit type 1 TsaB [Paracoccus sp. CPCC 101403]
MAEPLSLGFDTSAAHCAAALLSGDTVLTQRHEEMSRGQAERLFPLLTEILAEAGADWRDLSVLGVGTGPGNFTGIRIAVAAARGLSLSLRIPAIGVSLTEAAALDLPRPCRVAVPARGGDVIWQDFGADALSGPEQGAIHALPPGPPLLAPRYPLAVAIARIALTRRDVPDQPRPAPIYLRPADAAPARDRGPVILS